MEYRTLGRTGIEVSLIGFGCGGQGGLMVRGEPAEQVRAVERAIELGVTYFDTAPMYGNGLSETNLGRVLAELDANLVATIGTKVRLTPDDMADPVAAVRRSVEGSLSRLGRDWVDLLQLHNPVALRKNEAEGAISIEDAVGPVIEGMRAVRNAGLTRFLGFTGLGDPEALLALANTGLFDTVQAYFNVINPSAGHPVKKGFPGQDFGLLIDRAAGKRMGVLAIRIMAAGAVTGSDERHPIAATSSGYLTPGTTYETDLADTRELMQVIERAGLRSTAELAVRFALSKPEVSTVLIGFSDTKQLEEGVRWANDGPLGPDVFRALSEVGHLAYSYQ